MKSKYKNKLSIAAILMIVISSGAYVIFANKSDVEVKKERLEKLETEYKDNQRKMEEEILAMPRNSEEDWKKVREAEAKLKELPMTSEANQLISQLEPSVAEKLKTDLETRIFYSRDTLISENYKDMVESENDPILKEKYKKAAKIVEQRKHLLDQVEKDFKDGKGTFEELNKRIDELMAIDPVGNE